MPLRKMMINRSHSGSFVSYTLEKLLKHWYGVLKFNTYLTIQDLNSKAFDEISRLKSISISKV